MWKRRIFQFIFGLIIVAVLSSGVNVLADALGYSATQQVYASPGTQLGGECC